jgi:hypothetical protein
LAQPALALQLLWEFPNQQRPAPEPQDSDDPIYNEPRAAYDRSTTAPEEDRVDITAEDSSADSPTELEAELAAPTADSAVEREGQTLTDSPGEPRAGRGLISYEIPRRIREAMFLRMPASCFPYATSTGRLELDHTKAYLPPARGGPPGQTRVHRLGPLIRLEHRIKTHGRWRVRQPEPGCGFGDHRMARTTW